MQFHITREEFRACQGGMALRNTPRILAGTHGGHCGSGGKPQVDWTSQGLQTSSASVEPPVGLCGCPSAAHPGGQQHSDSPFLSYTVLDTQVTRHTEKQDEGKRL